MDSSQAVVATSGALNSITSYLNGTLTNLTSAIYESSEYLSENLGIPQSVFYTSLLALAAGVPITMSRYGWSSNRDSPYTSGIPPVTDEDFSYITSQDLDDPPYLNTSEAHRSQRSHSLAPQGPEDDVLIIKNRGVTYPAHFPAYTIGDGKLKVRDVRERVGIMMDLSDRAARRIKLLYKGRQLKEAAAPVRDYGVKDKSQLMAVLPEMMDDSSQSGEEMVFVEDTRDDPKKRRKGKGKKGNKRPDVSGADAGDSATSSNAFDPSLPAMKKREVPAPIQKLNEIRNLYNEKWVPLCKEYIKSPPTDDKKRGDDHRKLSESLLQQILLKLDGVETEGIEEVRTKRKELVKEVQSMLKQLDTAKAS